MTTYKNIKGIEIKYLSADPPAPNAGQVWYNTTTKVVKGAINGIGAWSSGGELNTARSNNSGLGSQTAAIVVGGSATPDAVELYNGTSWSEIAEINTGRLYMASGGTSTAGITFGGVPNIANRNMEWHCLD